MVQVVVPEGAAPGSHMLVRMPSGTDCSIEIPPNAPPGAVLVVPDPGATPRPVQAVAPPVERKSSWFGGSPRQAQPPAPPVGTVVAIEATGDVSGVSGFQCLGQQHMPSGWDLFGDKYGIVAKTLQPGEVVKSEPGAMVFMSDNVEMSAKTGGGRGLKGAFSQVVSGEALVTVDYRNNGPGVGHVGFTANQPFSTVVPVQLGAVPGGALNVKRGAYMAGTTDVHASAKRLPAKNMLACCCGGLPPVIQVVKGPPSGVAFLSAAGTVVSRQLQAGESIQVDSDVIVGFEQSVQFDVKKTGDIVTVCCGGEGCFNTVLTGPGHVYLQSISVDKLMSQLVTINKESEPQDGGGGGPAAAEMAR